jgi:hypothetical protein
LTRRGAQRNPQLASTVWGAYDIIKQAVSESARQSGEKETEAKRNPAPSEQLSCWQQSCIAALAARSAGLDALATFGYCRRPSPRGLC